MKKSKVSTKSTKAKTSRSPKRSTRGVQATEHDFIIIIGGGLVVLMLTIFLFLQ